MGLSAATRVLGETDRQTSCVSDTFLVPVPNHPFMPYPACSLLLHEGSYFLSFQFQLLPGLFCSQNVPNSNILSPTPHHEPAGSPLTLPSESSRLLHARYHEIPISRLAPPPSTLNPQVTVNTSKLPNCSRYPRTLPECPNEFHSQQITSSTDQKVLVCF